MYIVYKHTNTINQKNYIGITKYDNNPNYRWKNGRGYIQNEEFFADILKYGWDNFTHTILEKDLDELQALNKEAYYIEKYDAIKNGYNKSARGNIPSEEGIQALKKALTGIKRNTSSIEKQMNTKKRLYGNGRGLNYLGPTKKVKCNETGDIFASIAEANRWSGTNKVGECCKGNRQHAGKHPQTKELLTWSFVDEDAEVSIECNEDIQERKEIQKVQCVETQKIYNNATEAQRDTGVSRCNILRVCKGERKSAGKLHWVYFKEE